MNQHDVLVIEDDENSADLLATFLQTEGYRPLIAQSLAEARQLLVVHQPGVVLLDLVLPDGSGMDLFADDDLRGAAEIVLITGNASVETSVEALRLGAADYLIKPVSLKVLAQVLRRLTDPASRPSGPTGSGGIGAGAAGARSSRAMPAATRRADGVPGIAARDGHAVRPAGAAGARAGTAAAPSPRAVADAPPSVRTGRYGRGGFGPDDAPDAVDRIPVDATPHAARDDAGPAAGMTADGTGSAADAAAAGAGRSGADPATRGVAGASEAGSPAGAGARPRSARGAAPAVAPADATQGDFCGMVGISPPMQAIYAQIERVARTSVSVFVVGESGTGKELVAQAVHVCSRRKAGPFEAVNCGAISSQLIESELFGHEKGSFTGAIRQHRGFFERASGGTLFLDEVTEMPTDLQVKLLRVLETGTFSRVGSDSLLRSDVRIVAATNRDPMTAIRAGRLREDLYYRLNVFQINLPPLRERNTDVPRLAQSLLDAFARKEGRRVRFDDAALSRIAAGPWPGNVRELRNFVHRAAILSDAECIDASMLPSFEDAPAADPAGTPPDAPVADAALPAAAAPQPAAAGGWAGPGPVPFPERDARAGPVQATADGGAGATPFTGTPGPVHADDARDTAGAADTVGAPGPAEATAAGGLAGRAMPAAPGPCITVPLGTSIADTEKALILATLDYAGGAKERTAELLGISLKTLYNRLRAYGH